MCSSDLTDLTITGSGRYNSKILVPTGNTISVTAGTVKINNIRLQADHSTNAAYIIEAIRSDLYLENSELVDTAGNTVYTYLIYSDSSNLYIRGCLFESFNRRTVSALTPGTGAAASNSWMIYEFASSGTSSRMSIHQTTFAALGIAGACSHFICTTPTASTDTILLDDVYMHTVEPSIYTLFNDSSFTDNYYIGGTIVSGGQNPFPVGNWNALPPALTNWANFLVGTNRPR